MKRVKNYIDADLAKKKLARYKYWSIKDENGITIHSVDDNNPDNKAFAEVLDKIIADNVDAEIQIKYGTNEQSARQNPPFFIKVNEAIEWIEPEPEDTVNINGVSHKVDKNGNVNINLTTPQPAKEPEIHQAIPYTTFRDEMDVQLKGLRNEYELKEEKMKVELQNRMMEQTLKFKEMLLAERESRVAEREQVVGQAEYVIDERQNEINGDVKTYLKGVPSALGGLLKDFIKDSAKPKGLGRAEKKPKKRNEVKFSFAEQETTEETPEEVEQDLEQEVEAEIERQIQAEQEEQTEDQGTEQEATENQGMVQEVTEDQPTDQEENNETNTNQLNEEEDENL